jgi:pyruvate carboxylase
MRIVHEEGELEDAFHRAKSEAEKSFGNSEVYIERYIDNPKHIEVQIIGDEYGNIDDTHPFTATTTRSFNH